MKISEYFNTPDFNPNLLDTAIFKTFVRLMKQKYISYWKNTLQHSQKLEFYRSFKNEHTISNYLDLTRGTAERKALDKLRISNHKLIIIFVNKVDTIRSLEKIGIAHPVGPIK